MGPAAPLRLRKVGPLDRAAFDSLLPDGSALPAVVALVEQYVGHEFGWDLRLVLRAGEVAPCRPGRHGRLGWTSWADMAGRSADAELILRPGPAVRGFMQTHARARATTLH